MKKEIVEQRLIELKKALEQTQANGNALVGAIQETERWLALIKQEESEVKE